MKITNSIARYWIVCFALGAAATANAAPLSEARVSQVVQDVSLLSSNEAARRAAVNDDVRLGTAVRTGTQSRAELTFKDLTITRLGENTVFSLKEGTRDVNLEHGSVLLQVPSGAPTANIKTAAVTAAISGGTAMLGTGPPAKFMVLEGTGTFYPAGHPEEAVTLHGGEMVTLTADGHVQVSTFNVKAVLATSPLITEFPDLANLPLILDVQDQQQADQSSPNPSGSPPSQSTIDTTSQNVSANPTVTQTAPPSGPPSETGRPPTITTPDPYVISSGTTIQTDPTITTNGTTDFGTFYRGIAPDGTVSQFLFNEAPTSFDQMVFNGAQNNLPVAVFKFSDLELTGDPTVIIPSGGTTNLALVAVGTITSGGPGGTLTFAGIQRLDFITQNGAINLGSQISFSGIDHLTFYARGSGSNLTLASPISGGSVVHLNSEGSTQVNGNISVSNSFTSLTGQDFLAGNGTLTATNVDILSLNNINFNLSQFANPADSSGTVTLNAINTLNFAVDRSGGFGWSGLDASAETINVTGPNTFDFSNASGDVTFAAGNGGINAAGVQFLGHNLTLTSTGDITIGSAITPIIGGGGGGVNIGVGDHILDGMISAGGAFTSSGDVYTGTFNIGTGATVGGQLQARDVTVGDGLTATGSIRVVGGSILVGDNISTQGSLSLDVDENNAFGNITAGGSITANGGIFTPGDPCVVLAGTSISAPAVITGTLQAGTDITIDNSSGSFGFGIIANNVVADGTLTLINVPTISPNNASSSGADGSTFNDFTMTVGAISSTGPTFAVLSSNGGDANPNNANSNPGSGGNITVNVTAAGLSIGDGMNLASIQANGGAFNGEAEGGGNGGHINITTTGDVTVAGSESGPTISATTGIVPDISSNYLGQGGTVGITTSGMVTVNGTILVSSDDARNSEGGNGRESASGGTILLQSNLTTGSGITIGANGQLLSLLNPSAPGPGGSITLSTMGADITVNGTVEADRGTITMDQTDPAGSTPLITIDGATLTSEILNVMGAGDVNIGLTNPATINAVTILLSAANNLNWSGGTLIATATNSDGNVTISAGQAIDVTSGLDIERTNNGRTAGLNITLSAGTTLSVGGDLSLSTDASNIGNGGNIAVTSGGDMTVGGAFTLYIAANSGTTTGFGGNINVTSGGSLTAGSLNFDLFFDPSSQVTNGENLTLTVSNDLITTAGGVTLALSTPVGPDRPPLLNGGNINMTVGGNLVLASGGGDLTLQMINSEITNVPIGGNISASVGGNLSANQINVELTNFDDGIIGTGGNVTFSVGGNLTASGAAFEMDNSSNGAITTGGNLNLQVSGNLAITGPVDLSIENYNGGHIGTGGNIDVTTVGNLTVGSSISPVIDLDTGGSIGTGGNITFHTGGDFSASSFQPVIDTDTNGSISTGGNISLMVTGSLNADNISPVVDNDTNGNISTGGNITLNIGTSLSSLSGSCFLSAVVDNDSGGNISTGGNINVNVGTDANLGRGGTFQLSIENSNGGVISTGGEITASIGGSLAASTVSFNIDNSAGAQIGTGGNMSLTTGGDLTTTGGGVNFTLENIGGSIGTGGNITLMVGGNLSTQTLGLFVENYDFSTNAAGSIGTGGNLSVSIGGNLSASSIDALVNNRSGGMIGSGGSLTFSVTGALTTTGDAGFIISSRYDSSTNGSTASSTIGSDVTLEVSAASVSIGGFLGSDTFGAPASGISNRGSTIDGSATYRWDVSGDMTVQGDAEMEVLNDGQSDSGADGGGTMHGNATLQVSANNFTANSLFAEINNRDGGVIDSNVAFTFNLTGNFSTPGTNPGDPNALVLPGDAYFLIQNQQNSVGNAGGSIGGSAMLTLNAAVMSVAGDFDTEIRNQRGASAPGPSGGSIGTDAALAITATSLSVGGEFDAWINNQNNGNGSGAGGSIGGSATINLNLSGDLITTGSDSNSTGVAGDANFVILNANIVGGSGGSIASDAAIAITAANISTSGTLDAEIQNFSGGQIGGNATIDITTVQLPSSPTRAVSPDSLISSGNINSNYMYVSIDNTGGTIGGNATINMNVGGTATVTNDATVQILGDNPNPSNAINFNGGDYEVGGTFLSQMDGNGTIALNNTTVNADTVKVGVFGANGTLMIGGGVLSANTLMKLYATGSNGAIDFTANVTLTCKAASIILAANTITINDNVVVTIAGGFSASVYANIANYSAAYGGNGSTTGTFAGRASNPIPTASAPPFNDPPSSPSSKTATVTASTKPPSATTVASSTSSSSTNSQTSSGSTVASSSSVSKTYRRGHQSPLPPTLTGANTRTTSNNTIKVADSGQLLSLLDSATPSSNGKIMINSSKSNGVSNNPTRNTPERSNNASGLNRSRPADNQNSSKTSVALLDRTPPSVR